MHFYKISFFLEIIFLVIVNSTNGQQNIVYDYSNNKRSPKTVRAGRRPITRLNSNTIENIFQIPLSVIQGTSTAAQSWSPENGDTINKVFNIPIQTLQAISHLVKDQIPQNINNNPNTPQQDQQYLGNTNRKRHIHYNGLTWSSMWSNLIFGDYGHSAAPHRIKKKKKMKKPLQHGGHLSWSDHGGHGGHGSHLQQLGHFGHGHGAQRPQQTLGNNGNIYQVTEDVDDTIPLGSWSPFSSDRVQNKIAPKF